ncbi:hypothetical protein PIB30_034109 [Stylosanthes scabra]|uniref:Uncharacterized protein n=1 Tax=Stylosanthes scabra TaxID=79078 RepID=A0ABU6SCZ7_9FABA|nr:hypothetical protein [Stylosanthes scabra]
MVSLKKLAKKVRTVGSGVVDPAHHECLLKEDPPESNFNDEDDDSNSISRTPTGFFAVYIGEERQRYVAPTSYLSHPLFKMLLDKAYDEFGFDQRNGLVVPCSVSTFQQVINVIECGNDKFDLHKIFAEFVS